MSTFAIAFEKVINMVTIVQLVRASDCGSECRGFESHLPPFISSFEATNRLPFLFYIFVFYRNFKIISYICEKDIVLR